MTEQSFSFFSFVRSDLDRQAELVTGKSINEISRFKVFSGIASPRFFPVLLCRVAYWFNQYKLYPFSKLFAFLNLILFGIEISPKCFIGRGVFIPHPVGIVIGAWSIGRNVTIFQGVTLGAKSLDFTYDESKRPTIESDVIIGSGAKVLGGIVIKERTIIGANAVVVKSTSSNSVYMGIPAKVV